MIRDLQAVAGEGTYASVFQFESLLSGRGSQLHLNSAYQIGEHEKKGFVEQIGLQLKDSTVAAPECRLSDIQDYELVLKFITELLRCISVVSCFHQYI